MNNIIVGIGEVLWDILPSGAQLGGAPANFAYHISLFNLNSCIISAIGDDTLGKNISDRFTREQRNHILKTVPYPTGTVQVSLDNNGIPSYNICPDVAWDNIPFTSEIQNIASKTQAVCFGSLAQRNATSRNTINKFLETMPDGDTQYKIFDINLRQHFYTKEIITQSLNKSNILKINDDEILIIKEILNLPVSDYKSISDNLLTLYNLKMVILTCGEKGSYIFTPDNTSFLETPKINVIDTVGAGDSFTAAFTASLIQNKTIPQAHAIAVKHAAYVCTQKGATPKLP